MSRRMLSIVVLAAALAALVASCGKKDRDFKVQTGIAARVGDYKITEEAANRRFEELPEAQRKEFKGPEGKAKFVERLIEEQLLYQAALDAKLDKSEEMKERLRWMTTNVLVAEYFNKEIGGKVAVNPADVEKYYREHTDEFRQAPVLRAQYLFTADSLKAVAWRKRLLAGENMTNMARKESEDKSTSPDGGDLGYFNPGGYIKGIGFSDAFSKAVANLAAGAFSEVIRLENGFAVARINEKNPEKMKTLDEARSEIESKLQAQAAQARYEQEVARLKQKYQSENYVRERLDKTKRTPAELWEMAQMESDARDRIQYYRDIVNQYPTDASAPKALFMIGFTYAEDLRDFVQARRTFDELIRKYPDNEIVESARWMMDNMDTPGMKLESMENLQQKMQEGGSAPRATE